ncbi:TonB-dependent receptor [Chitinophaga nivalis]|uniref:TonB-dependent receptor n=1 Tax=Chitinophaga nivalis TaxID=2991709 RepID=A0ABT3IK72_9BACT|nr:TonB-dependent receptor [Chitinophaga nivalis]MCW3465944.1 TonB-dependent receptor [Chitinophaga nivalis]MCW3484365.1 TonB-dependent receptor [Chitinophaga nivalis]
MMNGNAFVKTLFSIAFIFFVVPCTTYAQDAVIRGVIREAGNQAGPIAGASVSITRKIDSVLVKTAVSDKEGKFELIGVPPGNYRLTAYVIGFNPYTLNALLVSAGNSALQLEEIRLVANTKDLKEIAVIGQKAFIEQQTDKLVVNVDASVTNVGSNVLEILQKSPGVAVDKDGNISLRGKQGVTVMIDGKPSYLSGADLTKLLSNMNASQLSQLEIIANPGARFDAAGNAGIINIKTKKNTAAGFNGSVTLGYGQGSYWRTDNALSLNYRNRKINTFLNYNYGIRNGFTELNIKRRFFESEGKTTGLYDQPSRMTFRSTLHNLKVGMDYFVSARTTIGFAATGRIQVMPSDNASDAHFLDRKGVLDSIVQTRANTKSELKNAGVNLNLSHQFDSAKILTADIDYLRYHSTNHQFFTNSSFAAGTQTAKEAVQGDLPVKIDVYSLKADYTQTFRNLLKMESGLKISQVKTNNLAGYLRRMADDPFLPDYGISNNFLYEENINALYLNFAREVKQWTLQAGLRFENTNYKGHQLGNPERTDTTFTRHYNNLFPNVFVGYKIDSLNEISFSYGRRIDRPAYRTLNPFLYYVNKYTYEVGNPLLLPQYTNNFSVSYGHNGKFTATASYAATSNYFAVVFRSRNKESIYTQDNLGKLQTIGLSLNQALSVGKWWTINLNADLLYKKVTGFVNGADLETSAYTARIGASNQFAIGKGWAAELSGYYNSKDVDGQYTTKGFGQADIGISKLVWNNKGTFRLNARDIFYSQIIYGTILYNNVEESYVQSADTRVVNLSFTYRFGKKLNAPARNKGNSTEQEQRRIN